MGDRVKLYVTKDELEIHIVASHLSLSPNFNWGLADSEIVSTGFYIEYNKHIYNFNNTLLNKLYLYQQGSITLEEWEDYKDKSIKLLDKLHELFIIPGNVENLSSIIIDPDSNQAKFINFDGADFFDKITSFDKYWFIDVKDIPRKSLEELIKHEKEVFLHFLSPSLNRNCDGDQNCLVQCDCICEEICDGVCICGHRDHGGYCIFNMPCCQPLQCRHYDYCHQYTRKPFDEIYNGFCCGCVAMVGRNIVTQERDECPICFENKHMIKLKCQHMICDDCLCQIRIHKDNTSGILYPQCPLCRNVNNF